MANVAGQDENHDFCLCLGIDTSCLLLIIFKADRMVVARLINESHIMGNDKLSLPKITATGNASTTSTLPSASTQTKPANAIVPTSATALAQKPDSSFKPDSGAIKNASEPFKSTSAMQDASKESKPVKSSPAKEGVQAEPAERTKMDLATEIYKQMMQTKGMTRKEVLEQFISQAKLSKAGASTYFQLIKAAQK